MKQYYERIKMTSLFEGITKDEELEQLLRCIDGSVKTYKASEQIIAKEEDLYFIGCILDGIAQCMNEDGTVQRMLDFGDVITAEFSEEKSAKSQQRIVAKTDCDILWVRWIRIAKVCNFACDYHKRALQNLTCFME